jgi:hypothetical protein
MFRLLNRSAVEEETAAPEPTGPESPSDRFRASTDRSVRWPRLTAGEHAPLVVVLALGLLLRVYLLVTYRPAAGGFNDSVTYLYTSKDRLFSDPMRMAGYPFFLRILRHVVPELSFVVAVQHVLGLFTGVLLYACVRRVTGGRWLPVVPAAFFLLSGDYLLLEHSVLTESLYMFFVTAALCAAIFAVTSPSAPLGRVRLALLVVSSASLGAAWAVRSVGLPLILLTATWLLLFTGPGWRARGVSLAAFVLPAVAVVGTYIVLQGALTGYWGTLRGSGWVLYPRVAPVADCRDFDPPGNSDFLCETTVLNTRPGPGYYQYVGGPGIQRFGNPFATQARGSGVVGRFARSVVFSEPLEYLREVGRDMLRYISPSAGLDRSYAGPGSEELDLTRRTAGVEPATIQAARAVGFGATSITVGRGLGVLGDVQDMERVTGLGLIALLVLACCAVVFGRASVRAASALLLAIAVLQPLVAVATVSWGYRYGVVGLGQLVAAAVLGVYALALRFSPRAGRRATAQSESPNPKST